MIKLKDILNEGTGDYSMAQWNEFMPTTYKLNNLIDKEVWRLFMQRMISQYNFTSGSKYYDPKKIAKMTGEQLNSGSCWWIVEAIRKKDPSYKAAHTDDYKSILKKALGTGRIPDHGFLIKNNKFYDAEVPNGVDNVWELPFFQRKTKNKPIGPGGTHKTACPL